MTNYISFDMNDPNTPSNILVVMHNKQEPKELFWHDDVAGGWTGLGVKIYTTDLDQAYNWYLAWNAATPLFDGSIADPVSKDQLWPGGDQTWNAILDQEYKMSKCTVYKRHVFVKISDDPGAHACESISYCHHYKSKCACGAGKVEGYAVPELR